MLFPSHFLVQLQHELHLTYLRFKSKFKTNNFKKNGNYLLNIAPGSYGRSGWINIDIYPGPNLTMLYDCRKKIPLPDNSIRGIFCEHFLEHMDYDEEVPVFLDECHRVLESTGVIRFIVPDAEKYLRAYVQEGWEEMEKLYHNHDSQTKMERINVVFRRGLHRFAYDFETLKFILENHGFTSIIHQEFGMSQMPELAIDSNKPERISESLYVDARKI